MRDPANRARDRAHAAIVACVALAVFAPTLAGGFVHDDHRQIVGNPLVTQPRAWPALWTSGVWSGAGSGSSWYRPLMMSSFALDRALLGPSAVAAHAVSLAVWVAVALLLRRFVRAVGGSAPVALAATLLGALHPVQVEAVAWISARCELLVAACGLCALLLHERALRAGDARAARRLRLGEGVAFLLALFAKESAVAFVPAFLALDRVRRAPLVPRALLARHAPWLAAIALYAAARAHALGGVSGGIAGAVDPLGLLAFFGQAALRLVAPLSLTIAPPEPPLALAWLGAALAVAGGAALAVAWRRAAVALVPLALGLAFLAIAALGAARLGEVADRYLLVPAFALAWLVAAGVESLAPAPRRIGRAALAALGFAGALATVSHIGVYRDDERLWSDAWQKNPRSVRAALNLGALHLDRGEAERAVAWLDRAAALAPGDPQVELNRAIADEQRGDAAAARARLDALAGANPGYWPAALRAGHLALDSHDDAAAARHYEAVLRIHPLAAEAWAGLGVARERSGDREGARRAIERSLALDPAQDNARALRAMLARLGP